MSGERGDGAKEQSPGNEAPHGARTTGDVRPRIGRSDSAVHSYRDASILIPKARPPLCLAPLRGRVVCECELILGPVAWDDGQRLAVALRGVHPDFIARILVVEADEPIGGDGDRPSHGHAERHGPSQYVGEDFLTTPIALLLGIAYDDARFVPAIAHQISVRIVSSPCKDATDEGMRCLRRGRPILMTSCDAEREGERPYGVAQDAA